MTARGAKARGEPVTEVAPSGANRITSALRVRLDRGQRGLIPFVCGGYPRRGSMRTVLPALARAGADVVEVGIPFSDPIADGPVIASAMHEALRQGVTPSDVFDAVRAARETGRIESLGLVAMVSVTLVHRAGIEAFVERAKDAGFDGFVFPDAPLEESGPLIEASKAAGMTASLLIAPTTPAERAERIARASSGFVYLLARMGITGEAREGEKDVGTALAARVDALRSCTDLPLACGFGISRAEDVVRALQGGGADAVIVGSALVRRMGRSAGRGEDPTSAAEAFVASLRAAADRAR